MSLHAVGFRWNDTTQRCLFMVWTINFSDLSGIHRCSSSGLSFNWKGLSSSIVSVPGVKGDVRIASKPLHPLLSPVNISLACCTRNFISTTTRGLLLEFLFVKLLYWTSHLTRDVFPFPDKF